MLFFFPGCPISSCCLIRGWLGEWSRSSRFWVARSQFGLGHSVSADDGELRVSQRHCCHRLVWVSVRGTFRCYCNKGNFRSTAWRIRPRRYVCAWVCTMYICVIPLCHECLSITSTVFTPYYIILFVHLLILKDTFCLPIITSQIRKS